MDLGLVAIVLSVGFFITGALGFWQWHRRNQEVLKKIYSRLGISFDNESDYQPPAAPESIISESPSGTKKTTPERIYQTASRPSVNATAAPRPSVEPGRPSIDITTKV